MKVTQTNTDDLNAKITIHLEKEDYYPKFKSELKKLRSKVQLKGFRKGRTPESTLIKMYGEQTMVEAVNDALQSSLSSHIVDTKLNLLGQPIPADDEQGNISFDPRNMGDYTFNFEVGLSPEFEVDGISSEDVYELYDVEIEDEVVDEELGNIAKRFGTREKMTEDVKEEDILQIKALELDGEGNILDKGWETGFTVMVDLLDDDIKAEVLKAKAGHSFDFDIYKLEKDKEEKYVRKYLLNLDDDEEKEIGSQFRGTIEEVTRLVPAEMNQELFDNYFGKDKVTAEDEARTEISDNISKYYQEQSKQLMYRNIMDELLAKNNLPLPESFLRKFVNFNKEEGAADITDADFDAMLRNTRWTLINSKLVDKFEVQVEPEEIQARFEAQAASYLGQYGADPSMVQGIVNQLMQNREQVQKAYEELSAQKVFAKIDEEVSKEEKKIASKAFNEIVKELNQKLQG